MRLVGWFRKGGLLDRWGMDGLEKAVGVYAVLYVADLMV